MVQIAADSIRPTTDSDSAETGALRVTQRPRHGLTRYACDIALMEAIKRRFGIPPPDYVLIVGRYVWESCQVESGRGAPLLADLDDLRYRYSTNSARTFTALKKRMSKWADWQIKRHQIRRFAGAFVASPLELGELAPQRHAVHLRNVPWSLLVQMPPAAPANSRQLLFVGSLWYRPNAEGVDWFLKHVWPTVLQAEPEAELMLAGAAAPPRRRAAGPPVRRSAGPRALDCASARAGAGLRAGPSRLNQ